MTEMSDLIVDRHDIHIRETGSGKGVIVHRSEKVEKKSAQGIPVIASRPVHFPLIKKRKGKGDETNAVLTYLKESEAAKIAAAAKRLKLLIQHMERSEQAFLTTVELSQFLFIIYHYAIDFIDVKLQTECCPCKLVYMYMTISMFHQLNVIKQ